MDKSAESQVKEICGWLFHQVRLAGAEGVVFGVNGDINSAVTAALAQKAFGKNALGLVMRFQNPPVALDQAMQIVDHLGLRNELILLDSVHDSFSRVVPRTNEAAHDNLRERLAMATLYHFAACHNYLVLGTGDRSDWEIGNFTKHGNGAGDIFPIIHLLKSDVYLLGRQLNLPETILRKPFSTDLWFSKKDTSEAGFGYKELDAYLSGDFRQVSKDVQHRIRVMLEAAVHKKRPPSRFSLMNGTMDSESSYADEHEAYDKSIEALTLISKAITSDQYLEDILRLIVMVTAEVMNSSVCSLWLLDGKENVLRLRATQSIDREYLKDRVLKVGEGVVGKVVAENRPYIVPNVLFDPFFKEKELARRMGLVSMLSMPMRVKDRVIGVINCYTSHPHSFSDLQMNVLTAVANQAAVAIEKTELIVQTKVIQEELERRKIIERAKDLLMKRLDFSGEEAYRWLQKRSMNTRKSMREVSEAVLLTMES